MPLNKSLAPKAKQKRGAFGRIPNQVCAHTSAHRVFIKPLMCGTRFSRPDFKTSPRTHVSGEGAYLVNTCLVRPPTRGTPDYASVCERATSSDVTPVSTCVSSRHCHRLHHHHHHHDHYRSGCNRSKPVPCNRALLWPVFKSAIWQKGPWRFELSKGMLK